MRQPVHWAAVPTLDLTLLPGEYAVCRLPANASLPAPAGSGLVSVTRTDDELSVVCPVADAPAEATVEAEWRALKLLGPFDFGLTGVLAAVLQPLAEARIPIFAISTFDTDYVLLKHATLDAAVGVLVTAGHRIS